MTIIHLHKGVLLVGTGNMATEYAKVLKALKTPFVTVGRGQKNASAFQNLTGIPPVIGGIENWLKNNPKPPSMAIVAVGEEQLGPITRLLISHKVKSILIEKPGGINEKDLKKTQELSAQKKIKVFIAYNRRFYASVRKAKELIKKDGGVLSFTFDFTERSDRIEKSKIPPAVKKNWLIANSSHVIDLAFFIDGKPKQIRTYKKGGASWHPSGSIYAGAGITDRGALFSYHANWESGGRWSIEIMTPKRKLILRPLEKLQTQNFGSMEIEEIKIDDRLDKKFKHGLYLQVKSFLSDKRGLLAINEQVKNFQYYNAINKK